MNHDAAKDDATKDDEPTLGVRCAWCGKILRGPVGFANPADPLAWTHGICHACAKRFEDDALLPLRSMLGNPSGADGAEFIRGTLREQSQQHDGGDERPGDTKPQHFQQLPGSLSARTAVNHIAKFALCL